MAVKMRPTDCRTKRPRGALLQLRIGFSGEIVENRREGFDLSKAVSGIPLVFVGEPYPKILNTYLETVRGG